MLANIGDNPGGKEAVVPLDKYDLPKKGESAAHARQVAADNARIIGLLSAIAEHLSGGTNDYAGLEAALAGAYTTANEKSIRRMIEELRKR